MAKHRSSIETRFWQKVLVGSPDACWHWIGTTTVAGYGQLSLSSKPQPVVKMYAHRYSYLLAHGPIPDGMVVRHICDNPKCVNPAHLCVGSQRDNLLDMHHRKRWSKKQLNGSSNPASKLTENDVRMIRSALKQGAVMRHLASEYGVDPALIRRIRDRVIWRHLEENDTRAETYP